MQVRRNGAGWNLYCSPDVRSRSRKTWSTQQHQLQQNSQPIHSKIQVLRTHI